MRPVPTKPGEQSRHQITPLTTAHYVRATTIDPRRETGQISHGRYHVQISRACFPRFCFRVFFSVSGKNRQSGVFLVSGGKVSGSTAGKSSFLSVDVLMSEIWIGITGKRQILIWVHQSDLDGVLHQLSVGFNVQLFHHFVLVRFDSLGGQVENGSHFFHRMPFGQQLQHLALT